MFSIFQLKRLIRCFLNDFEVSHLGRGVLAPQDIVKRKSHFLTFQGLFFYFSSFFLGFHDLSDFSYFPVGWNDFVAFVCY